MSKEFRPPEERLRTIIKSIERTKLTKDQDYSEEVRKSIQKYWDEEDKKIQAEKKEKTKQRIQKINNFFRKWLWFLD